MIERNSQDLGPYNLIKAEKHFGMSHRALTRKEGQGLVIQSFARLVFEDFSNDGLHFKIGSPTAKEENYLDNKIEWE